MIDKITIKRIEDLLKDGKRLDGRKLDEFREVKVETGVVTKAEGSAIVTIGKSRVIAGVKIGLGKPFPDTPASGVLMTGAEMTAWSNNEFETGPPSPAAIELARVVDRAIREAKIIDLDKLVIEVGEKIWMVFVDIYTMNADGNLFDAAALAAMAALSTAKMPIYKDDEVIRDNLKTNLPTNGKVVSTTYIGIDGKLLVDPTMIEEKALNARLTVGIKDGNIVSLQKGGKGGFTDEEVETILDGALKHSKKLLKALK